MKESVDDSPKLTGELATFDIGLDYMPQPAQGEQDEYRCFVIDPGITEVQERAVAERRGDRAL